MGQTVETCLHDQPQQQRASAPLGKTTRRVSTRMKSLSKDTAAHQQKKERYAMQNEARAMLPDERVAFCMRQPRATTVDVCYAPATESAHYGGLMVCGSVWVCPVCAAKISERRRQEVEQAIATHVANGGLIFLATYTISHDRYDDLKELLASFLAARQRARQGRAAMELRERYGVLGTITVREVTWSKLNGWHPHSHELIFLAPLPDGEELDADGLEATLRAQWERAAEHEGLAVNEHGFKLDRTYGGVADYIAKYGREPLGPVWGPESEMTKGHIKRGRAEREHLTPFAMLYQIAQGRGELKPVFREYARCFKGKHQLVWSHGLRALLLGNEEALTDEEVAMLQVEEAVILVRLTYQQWNAVLANDCRAELLEVACSGDENVVWEFLVSIGVSPGRGSPGEVER